MPVVDFMDNRNVFKTVTGGEHTCNRKWTEPLPEMTEVCDTKNNTFFYPDHPDKLFKNVNKQVPNMYDMSMEKKIPHYFNAYGNTNTDIPKAVLGNTKSEAAFFCDTSGDRFHNKHQKMPLHTKQFRISAYDQSIDQFSCKGYPENHSFYDTTML
jgi:hypothetical protein